MSISGERIWHLSSLKSRMKYRTLYVYKPPGRKATFELLDRCHLMKRRNPRSSGWLCRRLFRSTFFFQTSWSIIPGLTSSCLPLTWRRRRRRHVAFSGRACKRCWTAGPCCRLGAFPGNEKRRGWLGGRKSCRIQNKLYFWACSYRKGAVSIVLGKVENNLFGGATSQPHPDLASKTKGKCDFLVFGLMFYALAVRCDRLLLSTYKTPTATGRQKNRETFMPLLPLSDCRDFCSPRYGSPQWWYFKNHRLPCCINIAPYVEIWSGSNGNGFCWCECV